MAEKTMMIFSGVMKVAAFAVMTAVFIFTSAGCGSGGSQSSPPGYVLPDSVMIEILTDIFIVEGVMIQLEYIQQKETDSGVPWYSTVFEKHGVDREQFRESLGYYTGEPEQFDRIYDKVVQNLMVIQDNLKRESEESAEERGETAVGLE